MDERIRRAIDRFHGRFYPEARVEFLDKSDDGKYAFLFSGHMCLTCGMSDYFVDFMEMLSEELGIELSIDDMMELSENGDRWVVVYRVGKADDISRIKRAIIFEVRAPGRVSKVDEVVFG